MNFCNRVYEILKNLPDGYVITYGQIAIMLGNIKYARAVGNALHNNPDPINVPCFRVVNKDGRLAKNFGFGGMEVQKKMLIDYGIEVDENYVVDLRKYGYKF